MVYKNHIHLWIVGIFLSALVLSSCGDSSFKDTALDADAFERESAEGPSFSLTLNGESSTLPPSFSPHSNNDFTSATDLNQITKGGTQSFSFSLNASLHEVIYENGKRENDVDIYRFYVNFPGTFDFALTSSNLPYRVSLYRSTSRIQKGKTILLEGDLTQLEGYSIEYPGAYYLKVKSKGEVDASSFYSLEASYQAEETETYFQEDASAMLWKASYIPEGIYPFFEELKGSVKLSEEDAYASQIASYQQIIGENAGDAFTCIPLYTITLKKGVTTSFVVSALIYALTDLNFIYDGETIRKYDDSKVEVKLFSIEEEARKAGIENTTFIKSFFDILFFETFDAREKFTNDDSFYHAFLSVILQGLDTMNHDETSKRYYSIPLVGRWRIDGTLSWDSPRFFPSVDWAEAYLNANEPLPSLPFSAPASGTYYAIKGNSNLKAYLA